MLRFRDVRKSYGGVAAVDGISFSLAPGRLLVLIGESGSGKTTALKLINRLVEPDAGVIEVRGDDVRARPAHELRRTIGYLPQGAALFPHLTVAENITVTPRLLGWPAERARARAEALLELVKLEPAAYRDRSAHALSGGQRQRVGFARALAAEPPLVLLDEPFSALDPATRDELQRDFRAIHDALGLTSVMVSHDMAEALTLADVVIVMREGRIVQEGAPRDLAHAPADPYVAQLVETPRRQAEALRATLGETGATL